ncbi:hypothetical protein FRB90_008884, partial [Tulasnella sp. 427]
LFPPMAAPDQTRPPRTLILCFDGTADSFDDDVTNVVRLFAALEKEQPERQLCYYQPGIGTYLGPTNAWSPALQSLAKGLDQMFAWYLDTHIMGGYRFLMQNYLRGDRICMFGFSRGAYTARCLAGMLNKIGLLPGGNEEHVAFAYQRYIDITQGNEERAQLFKDTFSMTVKIDFMGVWDTVASCGLFGRHLPFTASNHIILVFRHALALDERRGKFKPNQWHRKTHSVQGAENDPNQATVLAAPVSNRPRRKETMNDYIHYIRDQYRKRAKKLTVWSDDRPAFDLDIKKAECDVKEVWFPGCHADVGGGSVKNTTVHSLANASLVWMVNHVLASNVGVIFKPDAFASVKGVKACFGGIPGVKPADLDRETPIDIQPSPVKLDTVDEDNEETEPSGSDTIEEGESAHKPSVTISAPPKVPEDDDNPSPNSPPTPNRKRSAFSWRLRRHQLDLAIPQQMSYLSASPSSPSPLPPSSPISPVYASMQDETQPTRDWQPILISLEPPSRSSEKTKFEDGDAGPPSLSWLYQLDPTLDARSEMVDQLDEMKAWYILEWLPLWQHYQDRHGDWHKGFHFNRGKHRRILDPNPEFHESVNLRENYRVKARVMEGQHKI